METTSALTSVFSPKQKYFYLAVVALLIAGCGGEAIAARDPASTVSESDPAARPAATSSAESGRWVGVIVPRRSVEVSPETMARLQSVDVEVGEEVASGRRLARLDMEPVRQDLRRAEAALRAAQAEAARLAVELEKAQRHRDRQTALGDLVSQEEVATATLEADAAVATLEAARARVVEQRAAVAQLQRSLSAKSEVQAPFAGRIAMRFVDPGAMVGPGNPIVSLITPEDLVVRFAVPPAEAVALRVGGRVEVRGAVEGTLEAVIEKVAPQIDAASQLVHAEARILTPEALDQPSRTGLEVEVGPLA